MEVTGCGLYLSHDGTADGGVGSGDLHEGQVAVLLEQGIALEHGVVDDRAAGLVVAFSLGLDLLGITGDVADVNDAEILAAPIHLGAQLSQRVLQGVGHGFGIRAGAVVGFVGLAAVVAAGNEDGCHHQQSQEQTQNTNCLAHDRFSPFRIVGFYLVPFIVSYFPCFVKHLTSIRGVADCTKKAKRNRALRPGSV